MDEAIAENVARPAEMRLLYAGRFTRWRLTALGVVYGDWHPLCTRCADSTWATRHICDADQRFRCCAFLIAFLG